MMMRKPKFCYYPLAGEKDKKSDTYPTAPTHILKTQIKVPSGMFLCITPEVLVSSILESSYWGHPQSSLATTFPYLDPGSSNKWVEHVQDWICQGMM